MKFAQEQNEISNGEIAELRECLKRVRKEMEGVWEEGRAVAGEMREVEEENVVLKRQIEEIKAAAQCQ